MLKALARNGGAIAIRGAITVAFGLATLVWPSAALGVFMFLVGLWAFADGALALAFGIAGRTRGRRSRALLLEGLVAIAFAVVVWVWPVGAARVIVFLFAAWAVVSGVIELVLARFLWFLKIGWILALAGIASLIIGVLLFARPDEGAITFVWLIGLYAVGFGVVLIVSGLKLRGFANRIDARFVPYDRPPPRR